MRQIFTTTLLLLMVLFFSGCSSLKPYQTDVAHNLTIKVNTQSAKASLDVFDVVNLCQTVYQGSLELDKNLVELGVLTTAPVYLVVGFADSSFWGNSSSFISHDVLLTPRKNYRYEIDVYYFDDIYNVTAFEVSQKTGTRRELDDKGLPPCVK